MSVVLRPNCANCQLTDQLKYEWTLLNLTAGSQAVSITGDDLKKIVYESHMSGNTLTTIAAGNILLDKKLKVCVSGE